jgi:CRISPR-associated endonuclease/helicase Cas3
MPDLPREFAAFFELATGRSPHVYQRELGESEVLPAVVQIPTGAGKTYGLLVSWAYQRLVRGTAPRRLVYALPMRSLVEQTHAVATDVRRRLRLREGELSVHVLMAGEVAQDWRERPESNQILIGTIDMLLSRALNRGYAEERFREPVSFGLLNSDCRWVYDEVQLMGPARATSAQLDGLRRKLGTAAACQSVWASATVDIGALCTVDRPDVGPVLRLPDADRAGPLAACLHAAKTLTGEDVSDRKPTQLAQAIAETALARHAPASRTLVVLNTVDLAQRVATLLRRRADGIEVVLLHSRFRPPDRASRMNEALADVNGPGRIVVATQVIEAGVDTSARVLLTETAPFSSIVQRVGRCNRAGEYPDAEVVWLDRGPLTSPASAQAAAPYDPADLEAARHQLEQLVGASLSPTALEDLAVEERRLPSTTLRRRDLLDLFDTSPDLSGASIDVSRFIREDDERSMSVFFRELADLGQADEQPAPARDEVVGVPLGSLGDRHAWTHDAIEGRWLAANPRRIRPGHTVMLAAGQGGYSAHDGWTGDAQDEVQPLGPRLDHQPPGIGAEEWRGQPREWVTLADHLVAACAAAQQLVGDLDDLDLPAGTCSAVVISAGLHDLGKAHPMFQTMLLRGARDDERAGLEGRLWAKSNHRRGRHVRRHFRHELASALALQDAAQALLPGPHSDLVRYLVAAHHGRVRLSIRPAPDEHPADAPPGARYALGIVEGDTLPPVRTPLGVSPSVTLMLDCMELGSERSWSRAACALRDDPGLGPFRLAYLEALVIVADWRSGD